MIFWRNKEESQPLPEASQALDILVQRWSHPSCHPLEPASANEIRRVFSLSAMPAPDDLVHLYGRIGGMGNSDDAMWRLWPLDEVERNLVDENEYGVLFSDHMLDSWQYRIKPNGDGKSAVYVDYCDDEPARQVADSLDDFYRQYLRDPVQFLNRR